MGADPMTYLDFFPVPMDGPAVVTASVMSALAYLGLAIAFLAADPRSPTTRGITLSLAAFGLAIATGEPLSLLYLAGQPMSWQLRVPVFEFVSAYAISFWLLQVARTTRTSPIALTWIKLLVWLYRGGLLIYVMLSWQYPTERILQFTHCMGRPAACGSADFWIFAGPLGLAMACLAAGFVVLVSQRIDAAERVRAIATAVALPFMLAIAVLPYGYGTMCNLVGLLIFTGGAVRYHGMRGEQGVFMSRFLSPEVAGLVREKGLEHAMQAQSVEITVVSCDLRGFTPLSQLLASDQVIRLLNEYYDAIGKAVAEFDGTIKDYAGDGVLILVGAPVSVPDHAQKGIALARRLQEAGKTMISHWAGPEMKLGMGVGVASGRVTVGTVGSSSRMEYSAVGPAVNLASRLCMQAADGEILVDPRCAELAGNGLELEARGKLLIKGIGEIGHFALATR